MTDIDENRNIELFEHEYLNEFHKQWNERCMEENKRVQSICFSAEYARAQSQRMNELARKEEK